VEQTLRNEFMRNLSAKSKRDSHELLAEVFNNFDRTNEAKFMDMLQKYSPKDADHVRSLMFTFEDLLKTDDKGIQALLRDVEKDRLALALKGASDDLKARFFKNMSERASKIMQEDMQAMGPVRVKDVDDAQQAVITVAKKLIDDGQMIIAVEGGEDEFIT
jgi:flagellar motor switch protein FliG